LCHGFLDAAAVLSFFQYRDYVRSVLLTSSSRKGYVSAMQAKKDPEAVRRIRVRQLWEAGLLKERTAIGVLDFYGWLDKHDPDLLPPGKVSLRCAAMGDYRAVTD
jgi:hypothetical protein